MMNIRFLVAVLLLVLALLIQLQLTPRFGVATDALLATLITASFFLTFRELLLLTVLAIFLVNWQPALSWDLTLFAVLPLVTFRVEKLFSWQPWLSNVLFVTLGVLAFYVLLRPVFLLGNIGVVAKSLVLDILWGTLIFQLFRYVYTT